MIDRWMMNKAGLINFWYYDEEEFDFSDGRLLLRGSNGSGKSVTMQSFIPLLLDGNKSPDRLDPFGSKARRLENYLLGEDESSKTENTAYIYMEFKKENTSKYITIGIGLKAKRGSALSFWGFVINDGRRIGKDFLLYKNPSQKIPLSKKELKNRIGTGGEVKEGQREYMDLVNRHLFGFDKIEEYDELIKLLIQLRSPKLSKDFRPTVVYEIMNNSLQPLTDEDLRPMSEAIENMDSIKDRLDELKYSKKAAHNVKKAYDKYNEYILYEKARDYVESEKELKEYAREEKGLNETIEELKGKILSERENIERLEIERKVTEEKKRELEKHDIYLLKEEKSRLEEEINKLKEDKLKKEEICEKYRSKEIDLYHEEKNISHIKDTHGKKIREHLEEMELIGEDIKFDEQSFLKEEILKDVDKEYDYTYIKNEIHSYKGKIKDGRKILEEEEKINLNYDRALEELEDSRRKAEDEKNHLESAELLLSETKDEFVEKVHKWEEKNEELKLKKESFIEMCQLVNTYKIESSYDEVMAPIRREYNLLERNLNKILSNELNNKDIIDKNIGDKEEEIKEWKNKRDPEPSREEKVIISRKRLLDNNIPHIPLYKVIDFKDEVDSKERNIIEEALLDMGILDALIIPANYRERVLTLDNEGADKYIFSSPKYLAHELSHKLKIEKTGDNISREDIEDVLKSILLDEDNGQTYIRENGQYGMGLIRGRVSKNYEAKFIGTLAREKYRKEIIDSLEDERERLKEELDKIIHNIDRINGRIDKIQREYKNFPNNHDLETAINSLRDAEFNYKKAVAHVEDKEEKERALANELKVIKQKVHEYTFKIEIPINLKAFDDAIEDMEEYIKFLSELEREHLYLWQTNNNLRILFERKEENTYALQNIRVDLEHISKELIKRESKYKSILDQLNISDLEHIEREIDECIRLINELPSKIKESIEAKAKAEKEQDQSEIKINELQRDLELKRDLNEIYGNGFKEEYDLAYVMKEEGELYDLGKKVIEELKVYKGSQKNKMAYMSDLQEKYHTNRQGLISYAIRIESIFEKEIDREDEILIKALQNQGRNHIKARVRGKDVDFYKLMDYISESVEENENILRERDRQLFEDILAKTITKKIRSKIYHSEEWVKKMNKLMESMNTSSGLSFSLSWKSKSADTEEQLDTKDLVKLLRKDGNLFSEEELNKLSTHFRSKIREARRIEEETGKNQNFHFIIKEVLDYRKWFEFKLFYKKTNENKREMTNNAFYKFSGGEKAMAMYVPLFSAVYSKYSGARSDCPRIISLDEAFAGVDEKNIRDMFRLLGELELNFIINSQILWGDYDTVKSLGICELIRPNNADFVTVLRYKWNGHVKELILGEEEDYGQREAAITML
ncbi:MAG: TIGR02680 family protein [Anaeromicrobium sp.]|jgi:uncharacterized protein (TIGR02680 family)|uniref:TIGR02680 family protein n=1 Tax=Anaeromicrobium sp. TaxID=1929132 RepID=UPI0025D371F7|nr:TIGR02680 family protein [Anaeromicrobium sp.]MCT4594237.1 TIGR02680 family protein [Anaeromicrobium sp.]